MIMWGSTLDYDDYGRDDIVACRNWIEQIQAFEARGVCKRSMFSEK